MAQEIEKDPIIIDDIILANTASDTMPDVRLEERVISVDRVSRTQAGGRRMRFRALVVVGDKQGTIGLGLGKSNEIASAVTKATANAKKHTFTVPIVRHTIPHEIVGKFDTAKVLLKPATVGTSIIAGSSVRPLLDLAGIENVVSKCLTRTTNKLNNAYATIVALKSLKDIKEIAPYYHAQKKKPDVSEETTAVVTKAKPVKPAVKRGPVATRTKRTKKEKI